MPLNSSTSEEIGEELIEEEIVDVDRLAIGDIVIVKPGDRIPMDGRVIAGRLVSQPGADHRRKRARGQRRRG